jgi:hypothetical protein
LLADPDFIDTEQFTVLNAKMLELRGLLDTTTEGAKNTSDTLFNASEAGKVAADIIGAGFQSATDDSVSFGESVSNIFRQLVLGAIKSAVANAIALAFSPTPDNVATGGAAGLAKAVGYKAAIASLLTNMPKLHDGGMTLGPQLALIGDNPSGREAVIPMEKMGSFIGQVAGTNQNMNVTGRIHGSDILLAQERAQRNRGR